MPLVDFASSSQVSASVGLLIDEAVETFAIGALARLTDRSVPSDFSLGG